MSNIRKRVYGYLAEFKSASALYKAAAKVRDAGFRKWDCYTPYPVHGLDDAMGLKRSILPWFVFFGGITGVTHYFVGGAQSVFEHRKPTLGRGLLLLGCPQKLLLVHNKPAPNAKTRNHEH